MVKVKTQFPKILVALVLTFALMLPSVLAFNAAPLKTYAADAGFAEVNAGDYVEDFGGLKWRVIGKDGNGLLVRTDRPAGKKVFSAARTGYSNGNVINFAGNARTDHGTNYWEESDIRQWLNDAENGFANRFSGEEWDAIAKAPQKQLLWWGDAVESSVGRRVDPWTPVSGVGGTEVFQAKSEAGEEMSNYEDAYYYTVSDKIFLPDIKQTVESGALENAVGDPYYFLLDQSGDGVEYWLRTPDANINGGHMVLCVESSDYYGDSRFLLHEYAEFNIAIAPALYIGPRAIFQAVRESQSAEGEQNGYTVYAYGGIAEIDDEEEYEPELPVYIERAPVITAQPQGASVKKGGSVTLSVTAAAPEGGALIFQWYGNKADSNNGGTIIDGATGSDYRPPAQKAGTVYYYCVVTNEADGLTAKSQTAAVTVKGGLSGGAIAAIAIGSIELAALGGFCIYWFALRKKPA